MIIDDEYYMSGALRAFDEKPFPVTLFRLTRIERASYAAGYQSVALHGRSIFADLPCAEPKR
jgi:hypothetical protein